MIELKKRIEEQLPDLSNKLEKVVEAFNEWREFMKVPEGEMETKHIRHLFQPIYDSIVEAKDLIKDNIEEDLQTFHTFYVKSSEDFIKNYDEMKSFFKFVKEMDNEMKEDKAQVEIKMKELEENKMNLPEEEISIKRLGLLVDLADTIYFYKFNSAVNKFYSLFLTISDDIQEIANGYLDKFAKEAGYVYKED